MEKRFGADNHYILLVIVCSTCSRKIYRLAIVVISYYQMQNVHSGTIILETFV